MTKRIDRTGQRFGRLVVIEELGGNRIKCRCDCGRTCVKSKSNVVQGKQTSCGECGEVHEKARKDLSDMRFGKLTAIRALRTPDKRRGVMWICRCECGKEITASAESLLRGDTKSCGCLAKEEAARLAKEKQFDGTNIDKIKSGSVYKNNKTGVRGVSIKKLKSGAIRYLVTIRIKGKVHSIGTFLTVGEAAKARKRAEEKYFRPVIEEYEKEKGGRK